MLTTRMRLISTKSRLVEGLAPRNDQPAYCPVHGDQISVSIFCGLAATSRVTLDSVRDTVEDARLHASRLEPMTERMVGSFPFVSETLLTYPLSHAIGGALHGM